MLIWIKRLIGFFDEVIGWIWIVFCDQPCVGISSNTFTWLCECDHGSNQRDLSIRGNDLLGGIVYCITGHVCVQNAGILYWCYIFDIVSVIYSVCLSYPKTLAPLVYVLFSYWLDNKFK